jgi:hypothetical protein
MAKDDPGDGGVRPPSDWEKFRSAPWWVKVLSIGLFGLFPTSFFKASGSSAPQPCSRPVLRDHALQLVAHTAPPRVVACRAQNPHPGDHAARL